jgi:serine/threonine protein kinase
MAIREMSALLALCRECGEHPNVIHVLSAGEVSGIDGMCMIMPLHKTSLRDAIASGAKPSKRDRLFQLGGVLDAIAFLCANHMVHRDVKASNIMLAHDGRAVLCDFGLSKIVVTYKRFYKSEGKLCTTVAGSSAKLGTPRYMAP